MRTDQRVPGIAAAVESDAPVAALIARFDVLTKRGGPA